MSTAAMATTRDPFMPRSAQRTRPALALAIGAHVLLLIALAFGVNWRSFEPTQVAAELWSAVPQAAAPREIAPPPTPSPQPAPTVKVTPPAPTPAPTPPQPDPQIAIEKARRDDQRRATAAEDAASQRRADQQKLAETQRAEKQRADQARLAQAAEKAKEQAEKEKADKLAAAKDAAARADFLKRMQKGIANATGGPADTGTAPRSSGPSANYAGRIMARIKPNILLTDAVDGNPRAVVEVKLAPDGTIIGKRLVESSGVKVWDDAVLRAIERTEILPLDNGRVPPPFEIGFRPRD